MALSSAVQDPQEAPRGSLDFPISDRVDDFRRRCFPDADRSTWADWHWQLNHRVHTLAGLERVLELTDDERSALTRHRGPLPVAVTPYYLSLLSPTDASQPLRRTMIPVPDEFIVGSHESDDPLAEESDTPVTGIVHRYPDRALFLATDLCAVHCRYCTRSRLATQGDRHHYPLSQWQQGIAYVAATPAVRDVLISGGDPLALGDDRLEWLLRALRAIPHVELVRIGTKIPAALPQRITPELTRLLRRYHPLWMSLHFTHPEELTLETATACERLADAGIPLGSQTVLLKGINDDVATLTALFQGLLKIRVRPYYLYQCDPVTGTAHFRTSVATGMDMIQGLRGHTTGYAVPTFVVDAPGGGGKIPLLPPSLVGRDGDQLVLRNYRGVDYRYPDLVDPTTSGTLR